MCWDDEAGRSSSPMGVVRPRCLDQGGRGRRHGEGGQARQGGQRAARAGQRDHAALQHAHTHPTGVGPPRSAQGSDGGFPSVEAHEDGVIMPLVPNSLASSLEDDWLAKESGNFRRLRSASPRTASPRPRWPTGFRRRDSPDRRRCRPPRRARSKLKGLAIAALVWGGRLRPRRA